MCVFLLYYFDIEGTIALQNTLVSPTHWIHVLMVSVPCEDQVTPKVSYTFVKNPKKSSNKS